MPVARRDDGSIEVVPSRTRARKVMAVFMLTPLILAVAGSVFLFISLRMWTAPLMTWLLVVVFGVLLNPAVWGCMLGVVAFEMYWNGTALLYREGPYLVFKRLWWGKGLPHRTDLTRLSDLVVSVARYPRDESDPDWHTSFRPRVIGENAGSRVIAVGEGLSVREATFLAAALAEMTGVRDEVCRTSAST